MPPKTLAEYQQMFRSIYPPDGRSIEHAGVHLAEEIGEFSEAIMKYRGTHNQKDFEELRSEAADIFSCVIGLFNSMNASIADELAGMFGENCHVCHAAPCQCTFEFVTKFNS